MVLMIISKVISEKKVCWMQWEEWNFKCW